VLDTCFHPAEPNREGELQVRNRRGVDLLELRKAMALIVLVVEQPVLRFLVRIQGALKRHVGGTERHDRDG
jgi:hypothetical protein